MIQQVGPLPAHDDRRQHRHRAAAARLAEGADPRARRPSCSTSSGSSRATPTRYPAQLSGGQRQRVGLARALAADPPVLLMDEPFGALDPITRARLQQELRRLHREVAKTVIFVTHDIDEAITMGDRIAILREGGVLAQYDTPDAILAHPGRRVRRAVHRRGPRAAAARAAAARRRSSSTRCGNPDRPELHAVGHDHGPQRRLAAARDRRPTGCSSSATTAAPLGVLPLARAAELLRVTAAGGPVIPNFGQGSSCVTGDNLFCWDWVKEHWGDTLEPALVHHIELTAIAVGIGFVLAFGLALLAHRRRRRRAADRRSCRR